MRKSAHRVQGRTSEISGLGSRGTGRPPVLRDRFDRSESGSARLSAPQTTALLRMATRLAQEVTRRDRREGRPVAPTRTLRQVAFFAALNSLRSFDSSRRITYREWARSHAAAAVNSYLRDQFAESPAQQARTAQVSGNGIKAHTDLISRVATPHAVSHDSGLPLEVVRGVLDVTPKGFVLFFPGRKRVAPAKSERSLASRRH
jgi:hypothetical protein